MVIAILLQMVQVISFLIHNCQENKLPEFCNK